MTNLRVVGLVGLAIALLLTASLALRSTSRSAPAAASGTAATLGEAPPANVASDPNAAKRHVQDQGCLANCAGEAKACALTSDDAAKCAAERRDCEAKCR